jgi:serine/threonine-protein kinase
VSDSSGTTPPGRDALHTLCLADPVWAERYLGWTDLGRGGSATVVRTLSRDAGAEIAIKLFFGLTLDDRARFQREVQNAQRLTSPDIVRTLSPFARGSLAWIEMELVDGGDLRSELERRESEGRPFAIAEAVEIGAAIARALLVAHTAGVVHRDVKPANVLLPRSGDPVAKLGDFGIARILGATRLTATGLMAGTPQFASPELVAGQEANPASDVYTLSLCLFLMLSGNRFPFEISEGSSPARWLRAHAEESPLSIETLRPDVPHALARLVRRGLAKDPARRPDAAGVLACLAGLRDVSDATVVTGIRRRHVRFASLGLATFVLGATLGVVGQGLLETRRRAASVASMPAPSVGAPTPQRLTSAPGLAASASRPSSTPRPSPAAPSKREPQLRASLQKGLLAVLNAAPSALSELHLTLVGADGKRFATTLGGALGPGEEVLVSLDDFAPPPPPGLPLARLEVIFVDDRHAQGRTSVAVAGAER